MRALEVFFWIILLCPFYSMMGYPLLVFIISKFYRKRFRREPITPKVTQIISAYNEERAITGKLENSLSLDYPADKLEILVVSDASTDRTDEIVSGFADRGVKLIRCEGNMGKSAAINEAVRHAGGEILVFSDATGIWSRDSIRAMAEHYADPRVGCVSGWVSYQYDNSVAAQGFNVYQRFVMSLRRAEASFGSGFNAPGSIHSIRRSAFRPLPIATFGDMVDPYHTAVAGLRTTHEERAISHEDTRTTIKDEYSARLRICLRAWTFMFYALRRFPIIRSPLYCFQLTSHKFLRWLVGPLMLPLFILNAVLLSQHRVYQIIFAGQVMYYGATLTGMLLSRLGRPVKALSGLVFYNSVNLAYLRTFIGYLLGQRVARWRPTRDNLLTPTASVA